MNNIKQNYKVVRRLEVFYSGAAVRLAHRDGTKLACACADEVKVRWANVFNVFWFPILLHVHAVSISTSCVLSSFHRSALSPSLCHVISQFLIL